MIPALAIPGKNYRSLLQGLLRLEFDSRVLSNAGSWTDRKRGLAVTPPGTATLYAPDGSNFNGRSVHQSVIASTSLLRNVTASPPVVALGEKPYCFWVGRWRSLSGSQLTALRLLSSGSGADRMGLFMNVPANQLRANGGSVGQSVIRSGVNDTLVHAAELWFEADNKLSFAFDGVFIGTAGTAGGFDGDSSSFCFGGVESGIAIGDTSHALYLLCSAKPSDAVRAGLLALARADWKF